MKKLLWIFAFSPLLFIACEKDTLTDVLSGNVSTSQMIDGLKMALNVSSDTSITKLSKFDGYFGDPEVKLDLPLATQAAITALQSKSINLGLTTISGADLYNGTTVLGITIPGIKSQEDAVVEGINRAAESAANTAKPIFADAITGMSILDASSILLSGSDTAATAYLRTSTGPDLYMAYEPKVDSTLKAIQVGNVSVAQSYEDLVSDYNDLLAIGIPGFGNVGSLTNLNPILVEDLSDYTTNKALDGLYDKMGEEETAIRNDPAARVNDLLSLVFGLLD
ncbi:DUF4197 domain-containing protein [Croceimicrobium sp.]|uniref:DUF4197 domain-containing protein n=1 Tax=Croceimicrobium sp. TaxID=2828340 RepID=UPI003BABE782